LAAIEVRWAHRIDEPDITSLKQCAEDLKDKPLFSVIIYSGTGIVPIARQMAAIPFPAFFGI
jgi:hypothetical protein